jgi:hypothetical protein
MMIQTMISHQWIIALSCWRASATAPCSDLHGLVSRPCARHRQSQRLVCPSQALISAQVPLTMDTEAHIAAYTTPRYRAEVASLPEDSKYADWKEPAVQLPVRLELVPGISGWTTDYASLEE